MILFSKSSFFTTIIYENFVFITPLFPCPLKLFLYFFFFLVYLSEIKSKYADGAMGDG